MKIATKKTLKKSGDIRFNPSADMVRPQQWPPTSSSDDDRTTVLYHAGIAAADGQALHYVKENTPSGPMRDLVKFFCDTRENLSIFPAYRTTLSPWQRENFAVIVDKQQWSRTSFAQTFAREVEDYKLISFDLEMRRDEETEETRSVLAHFATASGRTAMFDLEQIAGGDYLDESMVLRDIPPIFRQWMRSEKIYTIGSAIGGDAKRIGFKLGRQVDMRDVFIYYRQKKFEGRPIIDIGETTKCGFGVQAWYSKGMDYKPLTMKRHEALYGPHGYKTMKGTRTWPDFKHWSIYRWKRDEQGGISLPGRFYNFHDANTGQACIASIFLDMAAGPSIRVGGECKVADAIESVLEPVLQSKAPAAEQELEEGELVEEAEQIPSGQSSARSGTITVSSTAEEIRVSSSPTSSEELSIYGDEEGLGGEEEDSAPPAKKSKPVAQSVAAQGAVPQYMAFWDRDIDRWNPYERLPVWGRRCEVCGTGKHAGYDRKGNKMCPMLLQEIKPICLYQRCGRSGHKTLVCEKLHQICPVCWHRGHDRLAGCASWGPREWRDARNDFEAAAPLGYFTMRRHHNERWGFFPAVFGTPFPYPLKYRDLLQLSVGEADRALAAQRPGIAVSAPLIGQPPPPPSPPRRPAQHRRYPQLSRAVIVPVASRLGDRLGPRPEERRAQGQDVRDTHPVSSRTRSASGSRYRDEERERGRGRGEPRGRPEEDRRGGRGGSSGFKRK